MDMSEVMLELKKWGNNLGVRLPAAIVREAHLKTDQRVHITVVNDQIIITPLAEEQLSLEQRLAQFDPERHGGETMSTCSRLGAEQW
jgi:antitoxin MazE